MFRKYFKAISICIMSVCLAFGLTACDKKAEVNEANPEMYAIYEMAVAEGETRSYYDWLDSIRGEDGNNGITPHIDSRTGHWYLGSYDTGIMAQGPQGENGKSAYEIAVANGYTGTEAEWLESINGANGKSAYELAVEKGYTGSEAEWLASLKGNDGSTMTIGQDGYLYINGEKTDVLAKRTNKYYTVKYDKKYEIIFDDLTDDEVTNDEWISSLPMVNKEYKEYFLGWYIQDTDTLIQNDDYVYGNVTLEARFSEEPSGLYQNGKYVKTWLDLREEFPDAITDSEICGYRYNANSSSSSNDLWFLEGELVIDSSITELGYGAFYGCERITSFAIPDSVLIIGDQVFDSCSGIKRLVIPNSVIRFGKYVFSGCDNLQTVIFRENCQFTEIGLGTFYGCSDLLYVKIPQQIEKIGDSAFSGCSKLLKIVFEDESVLTEIGSRAFYECERLEKIIIPKYVTQIGYGIFSGCNNLSSIVVDSENSVYHSAGNCLIKTDNGALIAGCKESVIPNDGSVKLINDYSFDYINTLESITIPSSIKDIGGLAFIGCDLENIVVEAGNEDYYVSSKCLISSRTGTLILGCKGCIIPIDGSVRYIGNCAFYGCEWLTSINIPESIISIGSRAFWGCKNLNGIKLPNDLIRIDIHAFDGCTTLNYLVVPNRRIEIRSGAFSGCNSLTKIYFVGNEDDWRKIEVNYVNNSYFISAERYYYSETQPTEEGNYWHYDSDGVTPVIWELQ